MFNPINFLKDWSWLFDVAQFVVAVLVAIFAEYKLNIINKLLKLIAKIRNKGARANISLEYKTKLSFSEAKARIKEVFRKEVGFVIKRDTNLKLDFNYDIYSISITYNQNKNLFFEVERIGCGINDLKNKINGLLGRLKDLSVGNTEKSPTLTEFVGCEIKLALPYKLMAIKVHKPKFFTLKQYNITLEDKNYKSQVEIRLDSINLRFDSKEAINPVLEKFL